MFLAFLRPIYGLLKYFKLICFCSWVGNPVSGASCSSVVLELCQSIPLWTANHAGAASVENAPQRGAPPGSRSTLEQIPLWEILLLEEIPG
jgi:hypothetical protein